MAEWYEIKNVNDIDSPALVIYKGRVKENIRLAISMVKDIKQLRPHIKTHKTAEAIQLMLEAGIQKFKCATIAEAELLGQQKAPDVLLAYQPVGPKVQRFIQLIKTYGHTSYSCLIDDMTTAEGISQAAQENNITIPVYIDLNVGMNRTGITPDEKAVALYKHCAHMKGLQIMGLHAYDGHIRNEDMDERAAICNEAFNQVIQLKNKLIADGLKAPIIIAGGTPTFPIHAHRSDVECSPGTFIYWDAGYANACKEQPFLPAVLVITRIISLPNATTITTDLGHKSIAAENDISKRVYFLNAPELKPISQSEEHLVLEAPANHPYKVGDVLYGLPHHICPTCALYERAYIVENDIVTGEWKMLARDRKITI